MKKQVTPNNNSSTKKKPKYNWVGFYFRLLFLLIIFFIAYFSFLGFKISQLQKSIVVENSSNTKKEGLLDLAKSFIHHDHIKLKGIDDGRVNILLLGMGGEGHKGKYLTDTIMLVSIDTRTHESAMLSIPRDLYVNIPETRAYTKINAVYTFELRNQKEQTDQAMDSVKKTIENVTGQPVHYYVALDFDGFKQIVDELGGVDVEVERDIYDSRYPGPNYSYETFEIPKGFHHLDAETALKYSRVRHTKGGDFDRAARQQQVLASAKKRAFSIETLANPIKIGSLIDILGQHLKTDIQLSEIPVFMEMAKKINVYQTTNKVLDAWSADSLLASTHVEMGGVWAYVLRPRARNYSQVYELAENIFDLGIIEKKQKAIEDEDANILIIPQDQSDYYKIRSIFKKDGYNVTVRSSFENYQCSKEDLIVSTSNPAKLFTLDDLTDKIEASVIYEKVETNYDIILCISNNTVTYLNNQNQKKEEEKYVEQTILSEDGTVLVGTK